jgi:hypothetical protein
LHNAISLQGEWEVGLSEIIFPKNFFNVDSRQYVKVKFTDPYSSSSQAENYSDESEFVAKISIPAGYYSSIEMLVNKVNEEFRKFENEKKNCAIPENYPMRLYGEKWPRFIYKNSNNSVDLELTPYSEISFSEDLRDIFGIKAHQLRNWTWERKLEQSVTNIVLEGGRHTLYIYCDILENVPVGDTLSPLLRTIDAEAPRGSMVHKNFDRPRYLPIQKKNFGSLEIDIRDGLGRSIPFERGAVIVTLHFKRAVSSYFLS